MSKEKKEFNSCEELMEILADYIDGEVDPALCDELEGHLADCNPCQVVVDNLEKTITLYKEGIPKELPRSFQRELHSNLKEKWKEKWGH